MRWLPPEPPAEEPAERLWVPPSLRAVDVGSLVYVVVEELLEDAVNLLVSDWPGLDEEGRLQFSGPPIEVVADRKQLAQFLAVHRLPAELRERPLRTGDTFAFRPASDLRPLLEESNERLTPEQWITPPVYDVSADARDVAKAAFYGAVTPTLDPAAAGRLEPIVEPRQESVSLRPPRRLSLRWLAASVVLVAAGVAAGIGAATVFTSDTTTVTEPATTTDTTTITETTTETETTTATETTTETETTTTNGTTEPQPQPDLTVILLPSGIRVGEGLTVVNYEIANVGEADVTQPFDVSVTIEPPAPDPDYPPKTWTKPVDGLVVGQPLPDAQSDDDFTCARPGCTVTVRIDASGAITESKEDNNTASASYPEGPG